MIKKILFACSLILCVAHTDAQIVVNSRFKSRCFEEMAAPLIMVQKFQNECLEKLESLVDETEEIETLLNKEKDPNCWKMYADCYNSIIDAYNNIVRNGTNQGTRNTIANIRHNSSSVRAKIRAAYEKRAQLSAAQYARLRSIEGMTCDRFYSDMSLDDFLNENTPSVKFHFKNGKNQKD